MELIITAIVVAFGYVMIHRRDEAKKFATKVISYLKALISKK
tara:strand:- start:111 stop:236 length:126 start_codon:yes stop_codon:yes gene_type:complete